MKNKRTKVLARFFKKALWLTVTGVTGIVVWFLMLGLIDQSDKALSALIATLVLTSASIGLYLFFRRSKSSLIRWTSKSLGLLILPILLCGIAITSIINQEQFNNQVKPTQINTAAQFNSSTALDLINFERAQTNTPPLSRDAILDSAATNLANDMVSKNYRSFEGRDPWVFLEKTEYPYNYASFFFHDTNTNEVDYVKSLLKNEKIKTYLNGRQFLFAGIGTAQKDKNSPILAVVYLIEPPKYQAGQMLPSYQYTSPILTSPDVDFSGSPLDLSVSDINPDDYKNPNPTPYQYKPPKVTYPKKNDCHIAPFYCDLYE